ncbi:hypothetical protein, partial [uncultured Duncaniella sp.]|uniref:hypothetical protein n=1 Tax=uncultured Duncaniella sp. TaxID=2768039 RepID=UPI0025B6DAE4
RQYESDNRTSRLRTTTGKINYLQHGEDSQNPLIAIKHSYNLFNSHFSEIDTPVRKQRRPRIGLYGYG